MKHAEFRFYEELNDFLPPHHRKIPFRHVFSGRNSVKDMVESLGVPHTEIDLILANGTSVNFQYIVEDNDRISVYPSFESIDITPLIQLRPAPLRITKFVLDVHLGRLASLLRLVGFDSLYRNDFDDPELAQLSRDEKRILLTRDRNLLKRNIVTHGYFVRSNLPRDQLSEVIHRMDLYNSLQPFKRCMRCNGVLNPIEKDLVLERIPIATAEYCNDFHICDFCGRLYWKGSHYGKLKQIIQYAVEGKTSCGTTR
jgi:uncharacterized protein